MGFFDASGRGEIYRIWFDNDPSGKCYVGQTVQGIARRKHQHIRDAERNDGVGCPLLDDATRRFGIFHMQCDTLETGLETQEELDAAERFWIKQYNSRTPNGYNVKSGGQKTTEPGTQTQTNIGTHPSGYERMLGKIFDGMDVYSIAKDGNTSSTFNKLYQLRRMFGR